MGFFDHQLAYASQASGGSVPMPTDGLVFYASLKKSMATSESGHSLTAAGTGYFRSIDGIPCFCPMASGTLVHTNANGIAGLPTGMGARTLSCWVFGPALASGETRHVLGYGKNSDASSAHFQFAINYSVGATDPVPAVTFAGSSCKFNYQFPWIGWVHLAVTMDSTGVMDLWVDGNKADSTTVPSTLSTLNQRIAIGCASQSPTTATAKISAGIAACRIYNRVLAADEIKLLSREFIPKDVTFSFIVAYRPGVGLSLINMVRRGKVSVDIDGAYHCIMNPGDGAVSPLFTPSDFDEHTVTVHHADSIDEIYSSGVSYFLELLQWPPAVKTIRASGFKNNYRLRRVPPIPKTVTSIGNQAFMGCRLLEKAEIEEGSTAVTGYDIWRDCNGLKEGYIPDGVSFSGTGYHFYPAYRMTKLHLPDNITTTGNNLCRESPALREVNLPSKLTFIGENAFNNCASIRDLVWPAGVKTVSASAFVNCRNLNFPAGIPGAVLQTIGSSAFSGCTNLSITSLPSSVTSLGTSAFLNCYSLALTELPPELTSIPASAFQGCWSMTIDRLPAGITSIGNYGLQYCYSIRLSELPEGLTSIGTGAFQGCQRVRLTSLPSTLTTIGNDAFRGETKLYFNVIPASVKTVGTNSFNSAFRAIYTSYYFLGTPTSMTTTSFSGCAHFKDLYVPWASGAVANAPWGLPNTCTIHYNWDPSELETT